MSDKFVADSRETLNFAELDPYSFNQGDRTQSQPARPAELDPYSYHQSDSNNSTKHSSGQSKDEVSPGKNPGLPDLHIDGAEKTDKPVDKPQSAGVERDAQNRITKINYPGGIKVREFGRDAAGNLDSVVCRDANGESRLVKENGKWFADISGRKLALAGNVELSAKGDFSLPMDGRTYKTEKSDGTFITEKTNASGARVASDKDGRIEKIARHDGSIVEASFDKGNLSSIVESTPDGKQTNWARQGDIWSSDSKPPAYRLNLSLQENGNTTYTGTDGFQHIIRGGGNELVQGPGKGKYSFDNQGRIQSIEYADGKSARSFGYDSDSNMLNKVTLDDKVKNKTTVYTRQGNTDAWTMADAAGKKLGTWHGEASLSCDGVYSLKTHGSKTQGKEQDPQVDDNKEDGGRKDDDGACNREPNWMDWNWKGWSDFGQPKDDTGKKGANHRSFGDGEEPEPGKDLDNLDRNDICPNEVGRGCPDNDQTDDQTDDQPDHNNDQTDDQTDDKPDPNNDQTDDQTDDKPDPNNDQTDDQTDDKPDHNNDQTDDQTDDQPDHNNDQTDDQTDDQPDHNSDQTDDRLPSDRRNTGIWHSFRPDGSQSLERVTAIGSRAQFDKNGCLSSLHRSDGSAIDTVYKGKNLIQVIESKPSSAERVTWTHQAKGDWKSDSPQDPEIRRNLRFNSDGDISFTMADGILRTVSLDGIAADERAPNPVRK